MINNKKDILNRKPLRLKLSIYREKFYETVTRDYWVSLPEDRCQSAWFKRDFKNYLIMHSRYNIKSTLFINKSKSFKICSKHQK